MKSCRLFFLSSAILLSAFCTSASATQIVCLINNSSRAIKIEGVGVGAATIEYEAHGGDKNRCWHVAESANSLHFVRHYTKNSAGQWQDAGVKRYFFQNLIVAKSYWSRWDTLQKWEANDKICGKEICVYHSTHTDVWRLYVVDK
jgi:hypothetical protein